MKPYLLTLASYTPGIKRFLKSLQNINVEHLAVQFEPKADVKSYESYDFAYPGHINKYNFVPKGLNPNRYLIYSDTDDVIFQRELPEFEADMILAKENVKFKYTIYHDTIKRHKEFEGMMESEAYNSGLYAMKVPIFYDWVGYLLDFPVKTKLNQLIFNKFINQRDYSISDNLECFCPLFANIHHSVDKKNGLWVVNKKLISGIHANGWTKRLL